MPAAAYVRRRRSFLGGLSTLLLLVLAVAGTVLVLGYLGKVDLSFLPFQLPGMPATAASLAPPKGTIAVPISAREIKAYTKISREHVIDETTMQLRFVNLKPEQIKPSMCTDMKEILGRVLDHDKPAGYVFLKEDFLPEGSRAGLSGGIPAGKRGMWVQADKVKGVVDLNEGDRFDLVATVPIDAKNQDLGKSKMAGPYGSQLALQASLTNWKKQATVSVIVQSGVIVSPMRTRKVPFTVNSLTQGAIVREKPVQEIFIAIDPQEVARLTEAMAVEAEIACVPRSGRPGDPTDSVTPDLKPRTPFSAIGSAADAAASTSSGGGGSMLLIERIAGSDRELLAVPRVNEEKKE
jgi:Flp pilus assembly protein CpaB